MSFIERRCDEFFYKRLSSQIKDSVLSRIYAHRGIKNVEDLDYSLANLLHFNTFKNVLPISERILLAILKRDLICVFGDFDTDGACATTLVCTALDRYGGRVVYSLPKRSEGHGLNEEHVYKIIGKFPDLKIILTVDNGSSSHKAIDFAKSLGIECIVTDHHVEPSFPDCLVLNPNQRDCGFPSKSICGVGVAFYLVIALRSQIRKLFSNKLPSVAQSYPNWRNQLQDFESFKLEGLLDLVALGTIADVVPLDKNNRILVSNGLKRIRRGECREGIKALFKVSRRDIKFANSEDLAFYLAPRLNSAGRLSDMRIGVECLMNKAELAYELDNLNEHRKVLQEEMLSEALSIAENTKSSRVLLIYKEGWHIGLLGVIAAKIRDKFNKNTFVLTNQGEFIVGSGRALKEVNIRSTMEEIVSSYPDQFLRFGGHSSACGMLIKSNFLRELELILNERFPDPKIPEVEYDLRLRSDQISRSLAKFLNDEVWGKDFERPKFFSEFKVVHQRQYSGCTRVLLSTGSECFKGLYYENTIFPSWIRAIYFLDHVEDEVEILLCNWRKMESTTC